MKHGKSVLALLLALACLAPLTAQSKPRLAVLPFTGGSGDDGNTISLLLSNQKEIRSVFSVVPRNDNAIKAVFREQNIQRSGLTDSDTISELGKQLNADFVVAGHIQKLGNKNLILITIVNVETLQQIAGDFKEYGKIEEVLVLLPDMTKKIIAASKTTTAQVPKLAVLPFDIPQEVNATDAEVLTQLLATEVANTGKYAVLPRTKTIEAVMKEQNIQRSGLTDVNSIKALGKATNADYVLAGYVLKLGTMNFFNAQILSVESGELLEGDAVEYQTMADGLKLMPQLSEKLTGIKGIQLAGVTAMQQPAAQKTDASGNNPYKIGDRGPAGGIIFYDKGSFSDGWRYLEAAPIETEVRAKWGEYWRNVRGTEHKVGSGKQNTYLMITHAGDRKKEKGRAAQVVRAFTYGGYTDWFLPSKDELNLMYKNLKAKGLGGFGDGMYWSSSQGNTGNAWGQRFSDGVQDSNTKSGSYSVRVVRAF